jgi:hypothetical protein
MQQLAYIAHTGVVRQPAKNSEAFGCLVELLVRKWTDHCGIHHGIDHEQLLDEIQRCGIREISVNNDC